MLFNSPGFAFFLPLIFLLYWFVAKRSLRYQNAFLLFASYFFYSCWDWRFLFLLAFSTFLDYFTGLKIFNASSKRIQKLWVCVSIFINLGFLAYFKYFNFFSESFAAVLHSIGFNADAVTLHIILPLGISFYTFHGLSYVFDIYNKKIKPTVNFADYALFVSFFPLLIAGPIERATHLLPQVKTPRKFDYAQAVKGLKQILWGLFKKMVIADNCSEYANLIFNHAGDYSASTLLSGALFFTFQIYGDFSGYSDIAIGAARLLGFDLLRNFSFPYFSRDIAEFWRRWHISLSSWFRDYLYIPLGGSKGSNWKKIRNICIVFLVSGFWHGANWTFIAWGGLNALYMLPLILLKRNRNNLDIVAKGKTFPSFKEIINIIITFSLTIFAWIFFRSVSISDAFDYISGIFSWSLFSKPQVFPRITLILIVVFMLIEWMGREQQFAIENTGAKWHKFFRWTFYYLILLAIALFAGRSQHFIYFQF